MAELELRRLTKRYQATVAVDALDLVVREHEFLTLLGPSGSGKTTVLRMVAGHVAPTSGTIAIGGVDVQGLSPERRGVGMVFQSYALFPHMTVGKNVGFGLARRRLERAERDRRVAAALEMVRMTGLAARYPRELSGGQQQRVALARALVIRPTVLLLDEPMSNLDAKLRAEVRLEIRRLQRELGLTTVLVTHDQEEALTMSDRVAVLSDGRLRQVAEPMELYRRPASRFVADFVGKMNLFPAVRHEVGDTYATYRLEDGTVIAGPPGPERVLLAIRPEVVRIGSPPARPAVNSLTGQLAYRAFLGELVEVGISIAAGLTIVARGSDLDDLPDLPGSPVVVWWAADRTNVLDP